MKKLEMNNKSKGNIYKYIPFAVIVTIIIINGCSGATKNSSSAEDRADAGYENNVSYDSVITEKPELAKELTMNTSTPDDKKFIKVADVKFKVNKVISVTEKIEDLTSKYGGYIIYSNLQNQEENYKRVQISRDSILISRQILVMNNMQLKIPNENLDSFIRNLNPMIAFLDYRVFNFNDVTFQLLLDTRKIGRYETYEKNQRKHIDTQNNKLKDMQQAEDRLLEKMNKADELDVNNLKLNDNIRYCTINIEIYQTPIIVRNVMADFSYVSNQKPGIFKRLIDSLIKGWWLLEEIIVFLVNIWGLILILISGFIIIKYVRKFMRNRI